MISLTKLAAKNFKRIREDEELAEHVPLRVSVKGGGCAGFEYEWTTCNEEERGDIVLKDVLVVNRDFELYLMGTTLDWEKGAFKSEFTITNPNSKSSCGCGESFSI